MSEHQDRLLRLAERHGRHVAGEKVRLVPDQPDPGCERDWILKIGKVESVLFPVKCSSCGVGGYPELIGVTDPKLAAKIIEDCLNKAAEEDWEIPKDPPDWTPSPDLDWSLEQGEEDF